MPDQKNATVIPGKQARRSVIAIGTFFVMLFSCMIAYIAVNAYVNRRAYMSNSYNRRQEIYAKTTLRGKIFAADGETVLAWSEALPDGTQLRHYPYGQTFAHAVGYAVRDKSGVESYANYDLLQSGANLKDRMDLAADGKLFPGNDVITTLEPSLQQIAYEALRGRKGAVIVTDPKTGAILAMVSEPSYDPGDVEETWEALSKDSTEGRLINRATQGLYPTGSTFKIITTLAYLRDHSPDTSSYSYNCYGSFSSAGETVHCVNGTAHGLLTLEQSFAVSCNASFVNMGMQTDRSVFAKTLGNLYFGKSLPCDLPHSISTTADPLTAGVPALMQLSIGQGETSMTPLHLHMISAAIANEGTAVKPYLVREVRDVYGKSVRRYDTEEEGEWMTKDEAAVLANLMRQVVLSGTGYALSGRTYEAAGKTGSAEHGRGGANDAHAWFTGFAPLSDPEICVTVIVEDAGSSSTVAVPVAASIFDAYFANR